MSALKHPRRLEQLIPGRPTSDGAGVRLTRLLTTAQQRRLDPYLMLDLFGSENPDDYIGGFPDHPHRGFETITYMLAGRMRHRDSAGHEGLLENGGVQWMTAGHGVIHSELPEQEEGVMEGFQLWLNLPAQDKLCRPWYQDFAHADLPRYRSVSGVDVIVIAGHSQGVDGAVQRAHTEPLYLDLHLPAGTSFSQTIPAAHNAFVVVYRGQARIGDSALPNGQLAILETHPDADGVTLHADTDCRAILVSGQPLGEPIVQYGPFVMNTEAEIHQAIADYRSGTLHLKI